MRPDPKGERIFTPRTPADFALIDLLVAAGHTNQEILEYLKNRHWRSEVIQLPDGNLACAKCHQLVENRACIECGQPDGGALE